MYLGFVTTAITAVPGMFFNQTEESARTLVLLDVDRERKKTAVPFRGQTALTVLGPRSRFGDKLVGI